MDKIEYREKLDEINRLVKKQDFVRAVKIVDSIEWRRVRNVKTLCTVSEVYEANERYSDSKEVLLIAYRRSHIGRSVLYRLVEVCVKLKEFDEAVDYYTEYIQAAPNDYNKYILKYLIYKGRGSSLEEQIKLLQEYKEKEYVEKWAYELANLYEKAGQIDKCLDECDDLTLWFNEGKYVYKAMELKLKYAPLTPEQRTVYDSRHEIEEENARERALMRQEEEARTNKFPAGRREDDKVFISKDFYVRVPVKEELFTDSLIAETEREIAEDVSRVAFKEESPSSKYRTQPIVHEDFDAGILQEKLASNMRTLLAGFSKPNKDNSDLDEPRGGNSGYGSGVNRSDEKESTFQKNAMSNEEVDQEAEMLEKQITGQLSIDDILSYMGQEPEKVEEIKPEESSKIELSSPNDDKPAGFSETMADEAATTEAKENKLETKSFTGEETGKGKQEENLDFDELEKAIESKLFEKPDGFENGAEKPAEEVKAPLAEKPRSRVESLEEEIINALADFEKENNANRKGFRDPKQILPEISDFAEENSINPEETKELNTETKDTAESFEMEPSIDDELLFVAIEKEKVALEEEKLRLEEEKERLSREKASLEATKQRERELLEQEARERAAFEEVKRKKEELELQAIQDRERLEREKKEAEERLAIEELRKQNAELELMAAKERELAELREKKAREKEVREREAFELLKREKEELELRFIQEHEQAEEIKNKARSELEEKLQLEIRERLQREFEEKFQQELNEKIKRDMVDQTSNLGNEEPDKQSAEVLEKSLEEQFDEMLEKSLEEQSKEMLDKNPDEQSAEALEKSIEEKSAKMLEKSLEEQIADMLKIDSDDSADTAIKMESESQQDHMQMISNEELIDETSETDLDILENLFEVNSGKQGDKNLDGDLETLINRHLDSLNEHISSQSVESDKDISSQEKAVEIDVVDSAKDIFDSGNSKVLDIKLDDAISQVLQKQNTAKSSRKPAFVLEEILGSNDIDGSLPGMPEMLDKFDTKNLILENEPEAEYGETKDEFGESEDGFGEVEDKFGEAEVEFGEVEDKFGKAEVESGKAEDESGEAIEESSDTEEKIAKATEEIPGAKEIITGEKEEIQNTEVGATAKVSGDVETKPNEAALVEAGEALYRAADDILSKAKSTIFSKEDREDNTEPIKNEMELQTESNIKLEPKKEVRDVLTEEELVRFSYFGPVQGLNSQLAEALSHAEQRDLSDKTSRSGNIVVMGNPGMGKTVLATSLIKAIFSERDEESPKIEYMDATELNRRDVINTIGKMEAHALVIERAGLMEFDVTEKLSKAMDFKTNGLLVLLEDEKKPIRKLLEEHAEFSEKFPITVNIPVFTNDELVSFGKSYAKELDYKIDDMAILALYNEIGNSQADVEAVSVATVKEIVDKAIKKSERFGLAKFIKIIFNKRYDKDDRIILYEKDFE